MAWLNRVLAAVSMAPGSTAVIDYAAFLSDFYGAQLEVLHVVTPSVEGPALSRSAQEEARTMFFRLLYRSSELRRALDAHAVPAARAARLILKVGRPRAVLHEVTASQRHQIIVVGRRGSVARGLVTRLADGAGCSVVPVDQSVRVPVTSDHGEWHAPCVP